MNKKHVMLERWTVYIKTGMHNEVIGTVTAKNFTDAVEKADTMGKEHGFEPRIGQALKVMPFCKQWDTALPTRNAQALRINNK
jgi:hypothetical protein